MANLKTVSKKSKAQSMGMHTEVLTGRTQQKFFNPDEAENFYYFGTYDVDFNKRTELDVKDMTAPEANKEIDNLMSQGYGTIVIKNPQGKHSLGVGILNKLNLIFEGSLGYFGMGSCDGPIVRINGRVGWSCAENLMAGKVVIEKNAGSCFGAAIRGGDLICKGSVGARTGIDMKGGTIIIGGDAGAFTHTSISIRDALIGSKIPFVELHISNIFSREEFRKESFLTDKAIGIISGFGISSYSLALEGIIGYLISKD